MIRKILLSLLILIAATSAVEAAEEKSEPTFKDRIANLAELQAIRVGYGSGTIRIVTDITKKVEFKESYAENPSRIIIDLKNTWLNPKVQKEIELKSLAAKKLRVAQFDQTTVRIVIESMADIRPFFVSGGAAGWRFVVDIGNAEFKENPELNKPTPKEPTRENPTKPAPNPPVKEVPSDVEIVDTEDESLRQQQEREKELQRREQELAERERELKEKQERELKEKQERELREKRERELKEKQEREKELQRRERELEERERELKEKQEREKELQRRERELEERERELKEKKEREREKELKKEQERREKELKKEQERKIKEQREREKELKKEQERREKERKKNKDKEKEKEKEDVTVEEPFKGLEDDLEVLTNLKGRKIAIDPGHGGNDAGAIGPTGVMEKDVTLKVALELRRLLEAEGAEVIMTRDTDKTVSEKGAKASDIEELGARCDVGNRAGAEIFISIHADSFTRPEARGTTGYYYGKSSSGRGQKLADCIRRNLVEQLGTPSRGTQPCNFYVVKNTDMPATLIELGFISNKDEEKLLDSKEGVQKAAHGILDGIEDYFG